MGQKQKTPDLAPPSPPSSRTTRRALLREPGRVFLLLKIQESCCAAIKFAVAFASLSDPRAVFSAGDGHADRAGPLPWNKHLVLPGGGARPPVGLLSLTSFSAGDLVPRPCMSSSYGCASCRLCLLRDRVFDCPRAHLLSSSTGSSHSSRSFCIQGATEVQDRQDQVNGHVGPFFLHLRPA